MKPTRCTLLLSIFISNSLHVSCNYVPITKTAYCIYVTLVFFTLYWWLSGLLLGMRLIPSDLWGVPSQPADQTATHNLLTPWCRVLLEKLTGLQLVKKFPAFHRTWRFITALTRLRHLSLSWANPIQSIYPHPTSWRSILILSTHLRLGLPIGLFPSGLPTKTLYTPSPHPYAPHAQPISFFSILSPAQYWTRSVVTNPIYVAAAT